MPSELLLDTGGLISLLDRSQNGHKEFVRFFETWKRPVVSTEAVLTEATHLLGNLRGGRKACLDFFLSGAATLVPCSRSTLHRCRELMEKYTDLPMDFADATLVVLAEELDTNWILTTDRRDFEVYRVSGRKSFKIKP